MTWVLANLGLIADRALSHLALALPAIAASFLIALPIGSLAQRVRWSRTALLSGAGLLYAIPSLPLFVLLPTLLGTQVRDRLNVVVALTLYGVALMVRSVAGALDAVGARPVEAATALGYGTPGRFWQVELPLAGPVLLAGLRVVAVSTISLATVSAVLGVSNLGLLFIDGFQRGIVAEVVAGIVATVLLALAVDGLLVLGGRLAMPWTRAEPRSRRGAPGVGA
jgi:osmoprotectant transport system permease protein